MYIPNAFRELDQDQLHTFIEAHSFGLLISTHQDEPFATHLPFLLDRQAGQHGGLLGHMARANPQWQDLAGQAVLVVFTGPHAYISPSWYEAENVVPTWNYVAVHAYGTCRLIEDPQVLTDTLLATVAAYERQMPNPWSIDSTTEFFQKLAQAVVGFHIEIHRLEGKWKLNQNHSQERRQKVVQALSDLDSPDAREIAQRMGKMLE
jgi:transcriptional regulator